MCGIAGFTAQSFSHEAVESLAWRMADRLAHRGPDHRGVWQDRTLPLALAHRRLSIVDQTSAGVQPMATLDGRAVLVFNGEIYNHREIRRELGEVAWRGESDTETLLMSIALKGLSWALARCVGMFAFALWEPQERRLHLVRDRMGEKPLYLAMLGNGCVAFASELKAIQLHPDFTGTMDRRAIELFLSLSYIPAPHSFYEDVEKILPGNVVTLQLDSSGRCAQRSSWSYWSLEQSWRAAEANPFQGGFEEGAQEFERIFDQAVSLQTQAEVPLGVFLSGGIDSSLVVASMAHSLGAGRVRCQIVGFDDPMFDESMHAERVARALGVQFQSSRFSASDARSGLDRLTDVWDEPFADQSMLPSLFLCQNTSSQLKVALSGDGGDELFWGYPQYRIVPMIWKQRALINGALGNAGAWLIDQLPGAFMRRAGRFADAMRRVALSDGSLSAGRAWLSRARFGAIGAVGPQWMSCAQDPAAANALWDAACYLPDDLLVKVDRASMACGLEVRSPFLDHRVVEFAHALPSGHKIRKGVSKAVLRKALSRRLDPSLFERRKMGFMAPLGVWLRGPLRAWAEDRMAAMGIAQDHLDVNTLRQMWRLHLDGGRDFSDQLFACMVLVEHMNKARPSSVGNR